MAQVWTDLELLALHAGIAFHNILLSSNNAADWLRIKNDPEFSDALRNRTWMGMRAKARRDHKNQGK